MPVKINYSKDENLLKVLFEVSKYKGDLGTEFLLKGLNAKDLGFNYAYADRTENVVFLQPDTNISKDIQVFKHTPDCCPAGQLHGLQPSAGTS